MLKLFKQFKGKEWLMILFCLVLVVAQVWLDLRLPDYMRDITTLVQTEGSQMPEILQAGGKMLLCAFGSLATAVLTGYLAARIAAALSMRLRSQLYHKVQSFSMEEIHGFSTASLITRSTNDITQIQMLVAMGLQLIVKAPIMAVMAIGKIRNTGSVEWSLLTTGAVVFLVAAIACIMAYVLPKFKKIQTMTDNINRIARENLTGLRVVRAYNAEAFQEGKFTEANNALTDTQLKAQRTMVVLFPVMNLVMNGISLGVYWIGAYLINAASMMEKMSLFSNMVVFTSYAMQVIMAFVMLSMIFVMVPRAQVSANRINEVLETKPNIVDGDFQGETELEGQVEFRHVSFCYPDAEEPVLHDISFTARKGETVAFIGATGSGKSTIANLIPRFYDATEGQVLVDGVDVRKYTQKVLHNKLGYVSQKAVLFAGTIASNVALGENGKAPATEDEIARAVEIAQAGDFVTALPDRYESHVAQGGVNFSGGQKQRLSIARAVCRKPEIYIFDDSFSALDYKTDRQLRAVLKKETAGVTSILIAQRIGTILDADQIIVLEDGKIVGHGTHAELMQSCPVYQEIAESQLSKEELGA